MMGGLDFLVKKQRSFHCSYSCDDGSYCSLISVTWFCILVGECYGKKNGGVRNEVNEEGSQNKCHE